MAENVALGEPLNYIIASDGPKAHLSNFDGERM